MFVSMLSHVVAAWFGFLLPAFATYKALSHRPVSEPELERWCQYWTVIGLLVAFEYLAEFFISWLPLYYELKTVFLLFLALPQTQGSTYIYQMYLQPFFSRNEADLDADILSIQLRTFSFAQEKLAALWAIVWGVLNKNAAPGQQATGTPGQSPPAPGAGLSLDSAMGLFRTYGPSLMNALQPAAAATPASSANPTPSPAPSASTTSYFEPPAAEHRGPAFPEPHTS
ncbi:TB2/DP1, HVA22 family-domain-containing protein [Mycena capillaripes]|nr:TB2/DP1, HVA22 family-domain-containing protein [Mycena capillaripes]